VKKENPERLDDVHKIGMKGDKDKTFGKKHESKKHKKKIGIEIRKS